MAEMNPQPASTTEKIVSQMHDAYYKARKLYILFSTLLFSNELVGFTIKEVSVFGTKVDIIPKHPKALEVGYFLVWIYSAVHFGIEWSQVACDRRKVVASQWDFWLTHSIAIIAGTVWGTQQIPGFQVAKKPLEFLLPFFVGLIVPLILNFWERSKQAQINEKRRRCYNITFIALCITAPVLTAIYLILFENISFIAILSLIGAFIIGMLKNAMDGITPFSPSSTTTPGDPSDPSIGPVTTQATDENNKSETPNPKQIKKPKSKGPKRKKAPDRKTS